MQIAPQTLSQAIGCNAALKIEKTAGAIAQRAAVPASRASRAQCLDGKVSSMCKAILAQGAV